MVRADLVQVSSGFQILKRFPRAVLPPMSFAVHFSCTSASWLQGTQGTSHDRCLIVILGTLPAWLRRYDLLVKSWRAVRRNAQLPLSGTDLHALCLDFFDDELGSSIGGGGKLRGASARG